MEEDQEGFKYPYIKKDRCIYCHNCKQVCPLININHEDMKVQSKAYAAKSLCTEERRESSSGGVFSILAHSVLALGGYVCGAVYGKNFRVQHKIISSETELFSLRGSKYAQSDLGDCFFKIQQILKAEKIILFVGTPCQVEGLQSFLGKKYDKLITVDMICHGVPSPLVWEKYLTTRSLKDAEGSPQNKINLRSKVSGWSRYSYSVEFEYKNGMSYCVLQGQDLYMRGFINNLFLRPSCAACHFKGLERNSDFTLGDFWGVWDQIPDFDDNIGISLVFVHTNNGKLLWDTMISKIDFREVNIKKSIESNRSAVESSNFHSKRPEFFDNLRNVKFVDELIASMLQIVETDKKNSLFYRIFRKIRIL